MSRFAKSFVLFLSCVALLGGLGYAPAVLAVTCTSTATGGNWNTAGTWGVAGCVGANGTGGNTPGTADTVIIATTGASAVTVNATETVVSVTVNAGATLTQSSSLTTTGDLDVAGSMTSTNTLAVGGATSVTGTLRINATTGSHTFTGAVSITGGTWNNSANEAVNFRGGLTNNGGTFTAGTATYTFSTNAQAIGGTSPITIPSVTVIGVQLTNNGTLSVTTALAGTGELINNGTLNIGFAGPPGITTLTATAPGNIVNYNRAGNQTVEPTAYHDLILSGSGVKTMTGVTGIAGDLTVSGTATMTGNAAFTVTGALKYASTAGTTTLTAGTPISIGQFNQTGAGGTFAAGANTITVTGTGAGTWNRPAGTFTTTGTVIFTGAAPQIGASNFSSLTINVGGGNTATLTGIASPAGNLTVSTGTLNLATFTANRTAAAGTLTVANGATLKIGGTNPFPTNYNTHTLGATSTVEYSGSTQSVAAEAAPGYGNLTLSGSLTKTASGGFTVRGDLAISGVTFAGGATIQTVNGDVSNTGTHTAATGSITLSGGAAAHALSGSGTYANLILNDANGATLSGSPGVSGVLTLTSGVVTTGANTLITSATCAGSVTRTGGWVNGNLKKTIPAGVSTCNFEVGDAGNYTPVSTTFAATTTAGNLTAKTTAGDHPSIASSGITSTASVNRYWTLTNGGVGGLGTGFSATFNFINPGDIDVGAVTANFEVENWSGAAWSATTAGTRNATNTTATGLTAFGDFAVGEKRSPTVVSINCTLVSCLAATNAVTVSWTVTFSASVTGVDAADFALVAVSGVPGAFITTVSGSGTTWTVTADTGIGSGQLRLDLVDNDTIIDAGGRKLGGTGLGNGNFTGQVYDIVATAAQALAEYHMDEGFWTGTAGEVVDSAGSYPGRAVNSANTIDGSRAIAGNPGTCRYGVFDNGGAITQGYVELPGFPNLNTDFTITAWIRTTDNTVGAQRIFVDDESNTGGYGLSLGEGGTGVLRFYARGTSVIILDTPLSTIANNTWYFVAGVADITNGIRKIYVYDATGSLLPGLPVSVASTGWGIDAGMASIGAETNASGEAPATNHFKGNIDELRVYQKVLNQSTLAYLATQTHTCSAVIAVPNHYELSLPTSSVACLPTTVTVTACTDATSPCTNPLAVVSGTTAVLGTSGGTLGAGPVTFGATGVASTTLTYPAAPNGTPVVVTLSGEQMAASSPRQCCPNGTSCVVANSCSTMFNTAGFIFSTAAGGGVATLPTQVAGTSSATNYLRAVKTNTTTQACEAALAGTSAVNFAYECNNPTTCYGSNLMSVNGGAATTIARNDNGSVASYLPVNLNFDANGNAPFTFNYSDVGQVKLWVSKSPSGSLLSTLTGSSNSFVVKPGGFAISNIKQTAPPQLVNPAAANAAGAKFVKAGENFTMNVSATTTPASGATITPNYGRELTPESVKLTSTLVAPAGGATGTFGGTFGAFTNGVATGTTFTWSEVGIISLTASVGDADYLGAGDTTGTTSVNIGRIYPDHLDTVVTAQGSPLGFAYSGNPTGPAPGQPFTVAVTARNALGAPTVNYNYAGGAGFAKDVNLSVVPVGTGQLYVDAVAGGTGAVPASKFLNLNPGEGKVNFSDATGKISFVFASLPHAEEVIQIHAEDADTVTSSGANGNINIRHGRLRVFNAFGSEKAALSLPLRAEYWSGNSWLINADDNFSVIPNTSIALSVVSPATLGTSATGTTLVGGQGSVVLAIPTPGATGNTGSVDLAINLGAGAADQSCLFVHPVTTGAAIPWLRSINGNCAATYDRDPAARGSFGIYAPETRKTIHVRELF